MMPGGHLASAAALAAASYATLGSPELAAGCFAGGFLIDFDHYLDYLTFEKQWRRPSPARFLDHYFNLRFRHVVLPLHSMELMGILSIIAALGENPLLIGYLLGAAMHLTLDVIVNGEFALKRAVMFYSFVYRASKGFDARELINFPVRDVEVPAEHPFKTFFRWRSRQSFQTWIEKGVKSVLWSK